jgi:hypothetical protein
MFTAIVGLIIAYVYRVEIIAQTFEYTMNHKLDISEGLKKEMIDLVDPVMKYMMSDRLVSGSDDVMYITRVMVKIKNNSDYKSGLVEGVKPIDSP